APRRPEVHEDGLTPVLAQTERRAVGCPKREVLGDLLARRTDEIELADRVIELEHVPGARCELRRHPSRRRRGRGDLRRGGESAPARGIATLGRADRKRENCAASGGERQEN